MHLFLITNKTKLKFLQTLIVINNPTNKLSKTIYNTSIYSLNNNVLYNTEKYYSNPLEPKLIRENVTSDFEQYFQDIPANSYIEYKEQRFTFDKSKNPSCFYENEFGSTGSPE